jgi:NEDD4-binding protein 2
MYREGQKIITKSNEHDENYRVGIFVAYNDALKSPDNIPMIEIEGITYTCFGITMPFTTSLTARLDKLTPKHQWEFLCAIKSWDSGNQFIIMRGLPGSGKSTLARKLAGLTGQVFSTDDFFSMTGEYIFNPTRLGKAHKWNQNRSKAAFSANIPIIVIDNTNTTISEMRNYLPHIELARLYGYQVFIAEPDTDWRFNVDELVLKNSHGVPKEAIQRMADRYAHDVRLEDILF